MQNKLYNGMLCSSFNNKVKDNTLIYNLKNYFKAIMIMCKQRNLKEDNQLGIRIVLVSCLTVKAVSQHRK